MILASIEKPLLQYNHETHEWSYWTRLTFGVAPEFRDFERRFDLACPSGFYEIRNCKVHGDADYTCSQLFSQILAAINGDFDLDDDSSDISVASSMLYTLGIEWI